MTAFAYNPLGYGHSSRFGLDDPCNASNASDLNPNAAQPLNQQNLLIPNPLAAQCSHSEPTFFQDTASAVDQLANDCAESRGGSGGGISAKFPAISPIESAARPVPELVRSAPPATNSSPDRTG